MPGTASNVPRPTESTALKATRGPKLPPLPQVVDLLIAARATDDRFGARHFANLVDRHLRLVDFP